MTTVKAKLPGRRGLNRILAFWLAGIFLSCGHCASIDKGPDDRGAPSHRPSDSARDAVPRVRPAGKLVVHVMDVGQGDAILIRCPDGIHELLIDAGHTRKARAAMEALLARNDRRAAGRANNPIEVVVASHPHDDHIGNMAWVLSTFHVDLYVDNGVSHASGVVRETAAALARSGAARGSLAAARVPEIDFCPRTDVNARILRPNGFGKASNPNDNSIVVRVDYGGTSFLFTGDAEAFEEEQLLRDPRTRALLDCDFLKVGHHGSQTSSTRGFLEAVTPQIAAISCGRHAGFKHPRLKTVDALLTLLDGITGPGRTLEAYDDVGKTWQKRILNRALYVTYLEGDLAFESDGASIRKR